MRKSSGPKGFNCRTFYTEIGMFRFVNGVGVEIDTEYRLDKLTGLIGYVNSDPDLTEDFIASVTDGH